MTSSDDDAGSEGIILNYANLTMAQKALIDQNAAGANNRVDVLVNRMAQHLSWHECQGPWCVSDSFADAVMDLSLEQSNMLVTIMARRLAQQS